MASSPDGSSSWIVVRRALSVVCCGSGTAERYFSTSLSPGVDLDVIIRLREKGKWSICDEQIVQRCLKQIRCPSKICSSLARSVRHLRSSFLENISDRPRAIWPFPLLRELSTVMSPIFQTAR